MGRYIEELVAEAVALPTNERVVLFERLGRTLQPRPDDPIAASWLDEAERRSAEMERGDDPGVPAEHLFAELRVVHRS